MSCSFIIYKLFKITSHKNVNFTTTLMKGDLYVYYVNKIDSWWHILLILHLQTRGEKYLNFMGVYCSPLLTHFKIIFTKQSKHNTRGFKNKQSINYYSDLNILKLILWRPMLRVTKIFYGQTFRKK